MRDEELLLDNDRLLSYHKPHETFDITDSEFISTQWFFFSNLSLMVSLFTEVTFPIFFTWKRIIVISSSHTGLQCVWCTQMHIVEIYSHMRNGKYKG